VRRTRLLGFAAAGQLALAALSSIGTAGAADRYPALKVIPENEIDPAGWQPFGLFSPGTPAVTFPFVSTVIAQIAE
jgi:hypothetical protein